MSRSSSPIAHGSASSAASAQQTGRRLRPHILLSAGFVIGTGGGILVGCFAPDNPLTTNLLKWFVRPVEQIFLTVLFALIVPLLFSAMVSGLARLRDSPGTSRLLVTTLAYMLAVSASAALIGMAMANLFRPGDGVPPGLDPQLTAGPIEGFPGSLLGYSWFNGWILAMAILSFAIGIALPHEPGGRWLLARCEKLFAIGMKVVSLVTVFAPLTVACFMFDITLMFGGRLLIHLSAYIVVVIASLSLQIVVTFFGVVWMRGGLAPMAFVRSVQEAALIAFCTSSSNATLPTALKVAEVDLGLPGKVVRPVLGIGTVSNQGGTTIYIAVTVLFVGQFFGMDLSFDKQALVFAIATLAGMGTAGVPEGAVPIVVTVLTLTGLPPEAIGLVIGVDRLLDMFRTLVNVVGDLAIAVAIARDPIVAPDDVAVAHDMW